MILASLHVLVNLRKTLINIPKQKHTKTGSSRSLAIILALEDPILIALLLNNELVFTESGIDKRIDVSQGQIFLRTVDFIVCIASILKVTLEYIVWVLWLHNIQIPSQALEMLTELLIGDDALEVSILTLICIALTC